MTRYELNEAKEINKKLRLKSLGLIISCLLVASCGAVDPLAQRVNDRIDALGEIDLSDVEEIKQIKEEYGMLTEKQKIRSKNILLL